ncbi:TATA-binding protein-associated factor TAF6 [Pneumocystis jirovecii RU7]|uniref:TBP-associated factor 6 n=1 Tax=Pneumocystis jirovecii (strain RU7) TaxID=1408657 RepID=A0A0W4ZW90_PNEJ7|nr:TATA-binding protein-associated factor TAF6 [Pneumocystis jirovecii RU7]KTW32645.1 hypothetical protein T551_00130 [Pneumocystis jirovecii RU7]
MVASVWPPDTVKDVAESIGISQLDDSVAKVLALDIEYRIHEVIQEAMKFMRHAKRTILTVSDISHALRVLNVEPLYGYHAFRPVRFGESLLEQGQPPLYYLEDDDVEFDKVIHAPLPKVPRDISYSVHWLAIEGVQPAIPQNPSVSDTSVSSKKGFQVINNNSWTLSGPSTGVEVKHLVKHVISKELRLYFERINAAILDENNERLRLAALASLRLDSGLHQLLPYFVSLVAEKITHNLKNLFILNMMMQVTWALFDNPNLFIEPYLHQIIPSILTCLVAKRLGENAASQDHYALRDLSASLLGLICQRFGDVYHTLKPRITRTLLKAFLDNKKPFTTHYGAIIGLATMGKEVIRVLIMPNIKIYELLIKDDINSAELTFKKMEATKCLEALLNSLRLMSKDETPDETLETHETSSEAPETHEMQPKTSSDDKDDISSSKTRDILIEMVGELMTNKIIKEKDEKIVKTLLEMHHLGQIFH